MSDQLTETVTALRESQRYIAQLTTTEGLKDVTEWYAERVRSAAWAKVSHLYPKVDDTNVSASLWARTVACPCQGCGIRIPLYTSPWLSKRPQDLRWLRPVVTGGRVEFEVGEGNKFPPPATKLEGGRPRFACPGCGTVFATDYVRTEGRAGRLGLQLLAEVIGGGKDRRYVPDAGRRGAISMPEGMNYEAPLTLDRGSRMYGMASPLELYTARQVHTLNAFADAVAQIPTWVQEDGRSEAHAAGVTAALSLCHRKLAQRCSTQMRWRVFDRYSRPEPTFGHPVQPMMWDFVEINPFSEPFPAASSRLLITA
ncbi:hypothetical protein [Actinomadura rupiterrae]|uniref:hypothetical protein n=1 Tax=Actinomadura rupiterrae TaxID=559627 RepID=UPI0020A2BE92|nr:hypothetical protein [Actinomadura rupiterrae]MCP2340671.1 adenine-specific DNA methylase [Actinomadura rupiterrae]